MTTEDAPLYAAREPIFPRRVQGWFRRLKWWLMALTLGIYYITPWIRWDRGPNLPDQAVLVDMANRRFFFFWIEIWPQEFYYVAGLLIMAGLGLFLFTSVLGRVWCGYACPQTVWTDLYILVERWIEGDRNARIRLWNAPWDARKIRLRATKWTVWFLIGLATGGAWVFYFADAPTLLGDLLTGNAPGVAYMSILVLTLTTFIFGGFMREQVCIYMCPWPRIQAAMMDPNTLTVAYRDWRGEPRGKGKRRTVEAELRTAGAQEGRRSPVVPLPGVPKGVKETHAGKAELGDCIDCNACVNVCPTGVDIRDGQQLGCITCALCIDACDDVMAKIGKPRGLIDYITLADAERERQGGEPASIISRIVRPRTILYFCLWAGIGLAMLTLLFLRTDIDVAVARDRNPTYVTLSDGSIRNGYTLAITNRTAKVQSYHVSIDAPFGMTREIEGGLDAIEVQPDRISKVRLFVTAPDWLAAEAPIDLTVWIEKDATRERTSVDTVFLGPDQ